MDSLRDSYSSKGGPGSSAELVYGTTLRVPGELISPTPTPVPDPASFATKLCQNMQSVKAIPPRPHIRSSHFPHSLSSTSDVLVRHDAVKTSLQQPYDGPYKVIKRNTKYYTILVNGHNVNISIDRLKPAFLDEDQDIDETDSNLSPSVSSYLSTLFLFIISSYGLNRENHQVRT